MKRCFFMCILLCGSVFAVSAQGSEFSLRNESGSAIESVYFTPAGSYDSGVPVLDDGPVEDQDSGALRLDAEAEAVFLASGVDRIDVKVFFDDGSSREWDDIDLDGFTALTIVVVTDGMLDLTLR